MLHIMKFTKISNHENIGNELPLIQSLWIGTKLSVMERLCIASFLSNGHTFHLYTYDEVKNIPEGTILNDASKIIPPEQIFKYKEHDSYSGFSNIFRYKLLLEKGHYWVDTDVICLSPLNNKSDYVFSCSWKTTSEIESCVIKVPPGSEIMEYCLSKSSKRNISDLQWGEIGPDLLGVSVYKYGLQHYVAKPYTFCPIPYKQWYKFLNGSLFVSWIELSKMTILRTKAVHLWNEMWRRNGVDKNGIFPKRSIYERLKRRYLKTA